MDEDLARRSHAVLMQAVEVESPEREALLAAACAGDPRLRDRVAKLLAAVDRSRDFLETPALGHRLSATAPATRTPYKTIGDYRIERVIGVGGMATVYEAIQQEPRRRVALKIMRQGLAHTSAVNRFKYETEVLARLQHPGIVQIFEAGAWDDGHGVSTPFFVMEYVSNARTITAYANEHALPLDERLRMFAVVCDAVQYGHQHGVIHRDLKPGNILVAGGDEEGTKEIPPLPPLAKGGSGRSVQPNSLSVPRPLGPSVPQIKVIDFGVARSIDPGQAWMTRHTSLGQLVGTLNYMSPEQCLGGSNLDIRTDVYSLGVILYELVCGRLPHDLASVPVPEALRIVRDDPPAGPGALDGRLRGDIDAIVMMAMDKDPDRRYPTVAAFAADIRQHLELQPIQARPATTIHRVRRFARRHRVLVTAAASVIAVLVGAGAWSTWAMLRWREEAHRAQQASDKALAIKVFLEEIVASADPATGRAEARLVDVLRDASAEVAGRFADHREVEADLRFILSRAFKNLGLYAEALIHARRTDEICRELLGLGNPRALDAANKHAWLLYATRDLDQATEICQEVIARTTGNLDLMEAGIPAQRTLAAVRVIQGEFDEAERILGIALATARRTLGAEHGETLLVVNDMAALLSSRVGRNRSVDPERDMQEATYLLLSNMDAFIAKFSEDGPHTLLAMINLANCLLRQQRIDEAEQYAQRVLELAPRRFGQDHGFCIRAMQLLGEIRFGQRQFGEAARALIQSIQTIQRRAGGKHTADSLSAMDDSLPILDAADELETGEAYSRILYESFSAMDGHGDTSPRRYGLHLARFLSRQGKYDAAEELFARFLSLGPEAAEELRWHIDLCYGGHLRALGRWEESEPCLLSAADQLPAGAYWAVVVQQELARLHEAIGNREEASRWSALANTPSHDRIHEVE